jgi:hypothetical protein
VEQWMLIFDSSSRYLSDHVIILRLNSFSNLYVVDFEFLIVSGI